MKRSYQTEATEGHILKGLPLTQIEALCYYGKANLADVAYKLRRSGFVVTRTRLPLSLIIKRMRKNGMEPFNPLISLHGMDESILVSEWRLEK